MCLLCLLKTLHFNSVVSQTLPVQPDRPAITITPHTLLKNSVQTEFGFSRETQTKEDRVFLENPRSLLRYGLEDKFELRLRTGLATYIYKGPNGRAITGIRNVDLGFKFNIIEEKWIIPKVSLLVHYQFNRLAKPEVAKDTTNGADVRFAFQNTISKTVTLNYNLGMERVASPLKYYYQYSFAPAFTFNEKFRVYPEVYGYFEKRPNRKIWPRHFADVGCLYAFNEHFIMDASAGMSLAKSDPKKFISIGGSYLF